MDAEGFLSNRFVVLLAAFCFSRCGPTLSIRLIYQILRGTSGRGIYFASRAVRASFVCQTMIIVEHIVLAFALSSLALVEAARQTSKECTRERRFLERYDPRFKIRPGYVNVRSARTTLNFDRSFCFLGQSLVTS